jgi:hypothetical protein
VLERERDGIANAETHAEVGRPEDTHGYECTQRTLQCKVTLAGRRGATPMNGDRRRRSV